MSKPRPSIITRIYTWIYGYNRENNYVPLKREHIPRSECWHDDIPSEHASHISERNPELIHIASLGNCLKDGINWLFDVLGKISLTQSEIANELNLKMDLAGNALTRVDEQIPVNFGEAFT